MDRTALVWQQVQTQSPIKKLLPIIKYKAIIFHGMQGNFSEGNGAKTTC